MASRFDGRTSRTVFRLPRSHWHCHLSNFDWSAVKPVSLETRIDAFVGLIEEGRAPHLIMTGPPGAGKSHIGVGIYRTAAAMYGTELVSWFNVPEFCEKAKQAYNDSSLSPWEDFESAKALVVMDDLCAREFTVHERNAIIARMIDTAYRNNTALVVTANPPIEEIGNWLGQHEASRLLHDSVIIPITTNRGDWRVSPG